MQWFKRFLVLVLAIAPLTTFAKEYNIAVVDMEAAITASTQYKQWKSQLASKFAKEQEQLQKLASEGNSLKEKEQKEADFLSKEQRQELVIQIQRKFQQFQQLKAALAQETNRQKQLYLVQIRPKVETIVRDIVEKEKIDLLFHRRALMTVKPDLDLTNKVIDELNK